MANAPQIPPKALKEADGALRLLIAGQPNLLKPPSMDAAGAKAVVEFLVALRTEIASQYLPKE